MPSSIKIVAGFASLLCTAACFSIAVSPALGTVRYAHGVAVRSHAQAVAVQAGGHGSRASNRHAVTFEIAGEPVAAVAADSAARDYAVNTRTQMFVVAE